MRLHSGIQESGEKGEVPARLFTGVNMCSDYDVVYGSWMSRVDAHMLPAYRSLVEYCLTLLVRRDRVDARLKVTMNGALQFLHEL